MFFYRTNKLISANQIAIRTFLVIFLPHFLKLLTNYYAINWNMNATLANNFPVYNRAHSFYIVIWFVGFVVFWWDFH